MAKRKIEPKPMAKLKAFREGKNLTQGELAYMCGIDKTALCCYETGKRIPNMHTMTKLAQALGVTLSDINEYEVC
ncbi:MAG: helix-turn-helix domain-containing protein [Candidatus Coproplasma sp.]